MIDGQARAIQLIQNAKLLGNNFLDLGLLNLKEIPGEIEELSEFLEELNLGRSYATDEGIQYSKGPRGLNTISVESLHGLANFNKLTKLHLDGCSVGDEGAKVIAETLPQLVRLNLNTCKIGDQGLKATVSKLKSLESLRLENNQITDGGMSIFEVEESPIKLLVLLNNKVTDQGVSFLSHKFLPKLRTLDLGINQLSDDGATFLAQNLKKLERLSLSSNKIGDEGTTSIGGNLKSLTSLDLARNRVGSKGAKAIGKLKELRYLDLGGNQVGDEGAEFLLQKTRNLKALLLWGNQIGDVGAGHIANRQIDLESLDLSGNQITSDGATEIAKNLESLQSLKLDRNQIGNEGAASIAEHLTELRNLSLEENQIDDEGINALANPQSNFSTLFYLNLARNDIIEVPAGITEIRHLFRLNLRGNPVENIPPELIDNQDCLSQLTAYFDSLKSSGAQSPNTVKVIFSGNGRVGKSCLLDALQGRPFDPAKNPTHAINIDFSQEENINLYYWDFGGQHLYHGTHRLFFQTRAVFLLVWDAETEGPPWSTDYSLNDGSVIQSRNYPLTYWLDYIRAFGEDGPVIIIQSKSKVPGHTSKLPDSANEIQAQFGSISFESIDSQTGYGIQSLKAKIISASQSVLNSSPIIPISWIRIQNRIQELASSPSQKTLELDEWYQIVRQEGLDWNAQQVLLEYLHDSGVVYHRTGFFQNKIILDQAWMVEAVYTLFDPEGVFSRLVRRGNGIFTMGDLDEPWNEYDEHEKSELLRYIMAAEVCYEKRQSSGSFKERTFVAPGLMSEDQSTAVKNHWREVNSALFIRYEHSFLHEGVMQSFLVRVGNEEYAEENHMWKYGAWITAKDGSANALVEANPNERSVTIQVAGTQPKLLLDQISNTFKRLGGDSLALELVSTDGINFVSLTALKETVAKSENQQMQAQNGNWVEINELGIFLDADSRAVFQPPNLGIGNTGDPSPSEAKEDFLPKIEAAKGSNSSRAKVALMNLIGEGNTEQVLADLISLGQKYEDDQLIREATFQSGRYNQLEKDRRNGVKSDEEYIRESNRIRQALITLTSEIPDEWELEQGRVK